MFSSPNNDNNKWLSAALLTSSGNDHLELSWLQMGPNINEHCVLYDQRYCHLYSLVYSVIVYMDYKHDKMVHLSSVLDVTHNLICVLRTWFSELGVCGCDFERLIIM